MKNRRIIITVALLIISVSNYLITVSDGSIRGVAFLSIFVIGALSGILLTQIFRTIVKKNAGT